MNYYYYYEYDIDSVDILFLFLFVVLLILLMKQTTILRFFLNIEDTELRSLWKLTMSGLMEVKYLWHGKTMSLIRFEKSIWILYEQIPPLLVDGQDIGK